MTVDRNQEDKVKVNPREIKYVFGLFQRFNKYLLPYWRLEVFLLFLANLSVVVSLITPYLGKQILDKGVLAKDLRAFIMYALAAGIVYIISLFLNRTENLANQYIERKIRIDLSKAVWKKIGKFSLKFFQARSTGECIFRANSDIGSCAGIISSTLPNIIQIAFSLVSITVIILFLNWKILIPVLAYQLLVILQIKLFTKKTEELMKKGIENSQKTMKVMAELFSHTYFLKSFGKMSYVIRKYFRHYSEGVRLEVKSAKLNFFSESFSNLSNKIFFGLISLFGSILVIKGELSLGGLGAIMAYLSQGVGAYSAVLNLGRQIVLSRISLERLAELLDQETVIKEKIGAKEALLEEKKIEFRDVSFGYEEDRGIINNLSFVIPPRSKIALVGHSGCGKTTILNLILRLYDVDKGEILLDDSDVRNLRFKAIYSQVSIAPQLPFLWNDTIEANIAFGNGKMDTPELIRAAKIAEAHSFIENFPKGYDTIIGEEGCQISQGQKQRVSIARAISKRPKILILDEAFSSIDAGTEEGIIENLMEAFRDSTMIMVSHRLSTVQKMDLVYFLKSPSLVKIGTPDELLRTDPDYNALFASQVQNPQALRTY